MTTTNAIRLGWLAVGFALAWLRLAGVHHPAFQALAHLAVGGWLGAWAMGLAVRDRCTLDVRPGYYGWLALALSLIELGAFLAGVGR